MKNLFFVAFFISSIALFAQKPENKLFQKISTGFIPGIVATTDFSSTNKPFNVGYGLSANINVISPKTYHNLMYGLGNNSIKFLSGYFLPKNLDIYFSYSQEINTNGKYLVIGIEKLIKAGDVNTFLFYEGGTNLKGTLSATVGVLLSIQSTIWKRE